jgi:hypothetical protein
LQDKKSRMIVYSESLNVLSKGNNGNKKWSW